jgi:hypothetical protein
MAITRMPRGIEANTLPIPPWREPSFESLQDIWEAHLARNLVKYISPLILIIGTIFNCATIFTVTSGKLGNISTRILFVNLAVWDTAVLYAGVINFWLADVFDIHMRYISVFVCRFQNFLLFVAFDCSSWGVLLLTIERFICVRFPLKARSFCTKKHTYYLLCFIVILMSFINSHFLIFFELNEAGICTYSDGPYADFFLGPWYYIDLIVYTGIPFLGITFCNVHITSQIFGSKRKRQALQDSKVDKENKDVISIATILLVVSTVFIFLTLPVQIYYIIVYSVDYNRYYGSSRHTWARLNLIFYSAILLSYLNNAMNFILYCLSGTQFRNLFIKELKKRFCKSKV